MGIFLTGSGFVLRPWVADDVQSLITHANDGDVAANLRDRFPSPYTLADAESWVVVANTAPVSQCAITIDDRAVGGIGIDFYSDIHRRGAELGYWLGKSYWGKGIMSGVVPVFVRECFKRFDLIRIEAGVFATNPASAKVLEKSGFRLDGIRRQAIFKNGLTLDEHLYSMLRSDVQI
ncbi:MAG: GNAT family N-acetyltransferase [Leptospirales bacterium]|nr:GNAT family N-acetyltransferase [Leptospirales bacterium]